ncbi:hypothetical protein ACFX19_021137 [Malus domestica]
MPGWDPSPSCLQDMKGFANGGGVRVLLHNRGIVEEDDLDRRWEEATGERVNEVIFLSKHTAVSNRPALTVHPIGIPHLREGEAGPQGGKSLPNSTTWFLSSRLHWRVRIMDR